MPVGYPTEAKHGKAGYRNRTYGGLSKPVDPSPRPVVSRRPTLPPELGFALPGAAPVIATPVVTPVHDPIPARIRPVLRPGVGRFLGPIVGGFATGWYLGTLIWGDPFAEPEPGGELVIPPGWNQWCNRGTQLDTIVTASFGGCNDGAIIVDNGVNYWETVPGQDIGYHKNFTLAKRFPDDTWGPGETIVEIQQQYNWPFTNPPITEDDYPYWTQPQPAAVPGYGTPIEFPESAPDLAPIMWPGVPVPNPYPDTLPTPAEQPSTRPDTPVRPIAPTVVPMPVLPPWVPGVIMPPTVITPGGTEVPVQPPTVVVQPGTGGGTDTVIINPPVSPPRTPPNPGTRERKGSVRGGGGGSAVRFVVNAYTETNDFINALYAGVPDHLRKTKCHPYDMYCQLSTLWDVWDHPDFNAAEFVEAFINNQFEDMFFGMIGSQLQGASQNLDILTGLNRAINAGPDAASEYMEEHDIEGVDLLPELVHDAKTGDWSLTWDLFGVNIPLSGQSRPVGT